MTFQDQQWLTLSQAADALGVHPTTLRRWADNGDIPAYLTPGGHRRFRSADIQARIGAPPAAAAQPAPQQAEQAPDSSPQPPALPHHAHAHSTGRAWADFALVKTRDRLFNEPEPGWLTAFEEDERDEKRELGRRLMALLMQHISAPADDHSLLIEARSIATRYAQHCVRAGLSAAESLEATTFFRDTMTEVALQMPHVAQFDSDAHVRLLRKLNQIFNVVQVSVVEYFTSADNDRKRETT
jgi:excisionase family DNA binding protein